MSCHLFVIGFNSILGQVVILRELHAAFYGIELIYIMAIGVWLLWSAGGAAIGRGAYLPSEVGVLWLFMAFSIFFPLDMAFIRAGHRLTEGISGTYQSFPLQVTVLGGALLPVAGLLGMQFQWAVKRYIRGGRSLGRAYGLECIGGAIGGLAATFLPLGGISNYQMGILCSLFSLLPLAMGFRSLNPSMAAMLVALTGLLTIGLWESVRLDHWMLRWQHPALLISRDSPYGRLTITSRQGQRVLYENNTMSFETQGTSAEEFVHLVALQHPKPEKVLVIGGGVQGLVQEMLKYLPLQVVCVELNPVLVEMGSRFLPTGFHHSLQDPRVEVIIADPRVFLQTAGSYDLILSRMPDPSSAASNRFYSREFFQICAQRLRPGGVFAFQLDAAENVWTPLLANRNASIYHTLKTVYQDVLVVPGGTNTFMAGLHPLIRDPMILGERFNAIGPSARLMSPAYLEYLFTNDRFGEAAQRLDAIPASMNTDYRPICFPYTSLMWLSQFFPRLAHQPTLLGSPGGVVREIFVVILGVLILCGVVGSVHHRPQVKRWVLVGLAGMLGIVLESLLLIQYQIDSGALYQDIGLLLTLFMVGMTVGAWSLAVLPEVAAYQYWPSFFRSGKWFFALLVCICIMFIATTRFTGLAGGVSIGGLMFATGFFVAGVFVHFSQQELAQQWQKASAFYAADLLGGCLGSILGMTLLIPVLGILLTSVFLGLAALTLMMLL